MTIPEAFFLHLKMLNSVPKYLKSEVLKVVIFRFKMQYHLSQFNFM
jgi:hypothetical protein